MTWEGYVTTVEALLKDIPLLERRVLLAISPEENLRLSRSLRYREQKLERLLSYQERWQLQKICQESGISGKFL